MPVHGGIFTEMGMPTASYDSANKKYVDDQVQYVVTGSNRFVGLLDTPHVYNPNRIYYADSASVTDNVDLQFLSHNTLLVGGNVILKPNTISGLLPKVYFDYVSGSYKFLLDTKNTGDVAFGTDSGDILYLNNNFVRTTVDAQVTGSARLTQRLYFNSGSNFYEPVANKIKTDTNLSVTQILGLGSNDQVQMYYSSSGVSPNKTVYMFAKMENDEKVIVASRVV